jgi:hypothetical protein
LGFFPDLQALRAEAELRHNAYGSLEFMMLNGHLKSEDVDVFINDQKQNGIDKLVNELQSQLNDWKASMDKE